MSCCCCCFFTDDLGIYKHNLSCACISFSKHSLSECAIGRNLHSNYYFAENITKKDNKNIWIDGKIKWIFFWNGSGAWMNSSNHDILYVDWSQRRVKIIHISFSNLSIFVKNEFHPSTAPLIYCIFIKEKYFYSFIKIRKSMKSACVCVCVCISISVSISFLGQLVIFIHQFVDQSLSHSRSAYWNGIELFITPSTMYVVITMLSFVMRNFNYCQLGSQYVLRQI